MIDKRRTKHILSRIAHWSARLGLQRWDVSVVHVAAPVMDGGELARIEVSGSTMSAIVVIATQQTEAMLDESVRHEMLHLLMHDVEVVARVAIGRLGEEAAGIMRESLDRELERVVISLERAIITKEVIT